MTLKGDLSRRVVTVDLDPGCEFPEERTGFVHPDLRAHVGGKWPSLLAQGLVVLRAYVLAGRPGHGKPRLGSFEGWDDLIRGACVWAGLADPCEGRRQLRDEWDLDVEPLRAALKACREVFGEQETFTVSDLADRAMGNDVLREAVGSLVPRAHRAGKDRLDSRLLGYALRRARGRIVDGLRFDIGQGSRHGRRLWRVVGGWNGGDG